MDIQKWLDKGLEFIADFGPKVIGAILIWIIGSWVIKKLMKGVSKLMIARKYDESLQKFLVNLLGWLLKILLILAVLGTVGVETTSFAAILAAAGLAVGLALQGSLANFAGGVLIMIFKPFKIGDLIEAQGVLGVVNEIEIFTTKLSTPENKEAIIPNGTLSNGNIINYTTLGTLRVDLNIGIGYGDDIKKAKDTIMDVLTNNPKVLKDPAPTVAVSELGDNAINIVVRPFANVADYWDVYFEALEDSKNALDKAGISIPYPQRDVHIHNVK
ncbi:mechanosensitive ion channel family protein [Aquimarina sp. 2201CG5-10]|uniref:mechanosensitive ion channel family protein n=1 Tax=Aquimarina callyspongiae TaxID=3098150 RepID=UPI002AB38372|nr:mechanosensitive ion channel domain-containing protein [Aquimarina sp. 2201CG5-10]MDY8136879.1 mechanosensitive ion channel [Aquimarina sp. 2201CG5-10]